MPEQEPNRLEKIVDKHTLYVSFKVEARNVVVRNWNTLNAGRTENKTERENFHSPEAIAKYLENMTAFYKKEGYAVAGEKSDKEISASELS